MHIDLTGQVAMVTGAAQGIGAAIARQFARSGATTVLADISPTAHLADELRAEGCVAVSVRLDVTDEGAVDEVFQSVEARHGAATILVNNAGISTPASTTETSLETWNRVLSVNLTGAFLCSRRALPAMVERGFGRIVNLSSLNAKSAPVNGDNASYAASKAGLSGLIRNLAVEFGPHGVTVNGIAPGVVDTELLRGAHSDASRARLLSRLPIGRFTSSEEVASLAVFLASPLSGSITGEIVNINGGLYFD